MSDMTTTVRLYSLILKALRYGCEVAEDDTVRVPAELVRQEKSQ